MSNNKEPKQVSSGLKKTKIITYFHIQNTLELYLSALLKVLRIVYFSNPVGVLQ